MSLPSRLRAVVLSACLLVLAVPAADAAAGTVSGTVFHDDNRNRVPDAGEATMAGAGFGLYDSAGNRLGSASADAAGHYAFTNVPDGGYQVRMDPSDWYPLRDTLAPTTTDALRPVVTVTLSGTARADFGWRPITRSTTASAPISSFTGPDGLTVMSYDDVVDARSLYDDLRGGALIGREASTVTVRFDLGGDPNVTTVAASGSAGAYSAYHADVSIQYLSWLDGGDQTLFHEYGHAWSLFYAYMVQQDTSLSSYLQARGIAGDARLDSSHAWNRRELIAEDYRQLFGSANARSLAQENPDLPPAAAVPGLRDFLLGAYMQAPTGGGGPAGGGGPTTPSPPPVPALAVSAVAMNPTVVKATGTAAFTLSAPATVTVTIKDAKGALVRTLLAAAARPAGAASLAWDRKTASGARAKSGGYTLNVAAADAAGTTASGSAAFSVS